VLRRLREGVELDDGPSAPATVRLAGPLRIEITIHEGRNRQVRRMLEAVGHPVKDLQRTAYGSLRLGRLKEANWRRLRPFEVTALRKAAGLE
jgi:23S rRNA pseudouridine2605 synthase